MAVEWCREQIRPGGSAGIQQGKTSRIWKVKVTDKRDDQVDIFQACNRLASPDPLIIDELPIWYDQYPDDPAMLMHNMDIMRERGLIWRVQASYKNFPVQQSEQDKQQSPDPLDRTVKISISSSTMSRVITKDLNNDAVVNSAGDPFDPMPEEDWDILVFNFRKNLVSPPVWFLDYLNSVNSSPISILGISIPAGHARFTSPSCSQELYENLIYYYDCSWQIMTSVRTFQLELLDEGLRKIDPNDSTKRIEILDGDKVPVSTPALLDGSGDELSDPSISNAVVLNFKVRNERNYSALPGVN